MNWFFKRVAKKAFNACGLGVYRKGTIRRTLEEALDHISGLGFKPRTVIDVGVAYGTFELYEGFPEAKHLLIEPLTEYEGVLREIVQKYEAEYVVAAASDRSGAIPINVHSDLSSSSILKETEGRHVDGVKRDVRAVTIDDLCREKNLEGPYLIKLDVQGAELQALDGARKVLNDTEVIVLEALLFQFYQNGPQFYDVLSYMKDQGFVVYDIFGGHNRTLDGALAGIEVTFVKENGQFRKDHFYATNEQRKQLEKELKAINQGVFRS